MARARGGHLRGCAGGGPLGLGSLPLPVGLHCGDALPAGRHLDGLSRSRPLVVHRPGPHDRVRAAGLAGTKMGPRGMKMACCVNESGSWLFLYISAVKKT